MYYEPGVTPHGLPHDPFKSCVVPRPIGWISTVDAQGRDNLAPEIFVFPGIGQGDALQLRVALVQGQIQQRFQLPVQLGDVDH